MAMCLSAFPPSNRLYPYLLCYVTQHGFESYKGFCQRKLLQSYGRQARNHAPCMLEWKTARKTATMASEIRCYDGVSKYIPVVSSLTAQEGGNLMAACRGIEGATGWTLAIQTMVGCWRLSSGEKETNTELFLAGFSHSFRFLLVITKTKNKKSNE